MSNHDFNKTSDTCDPAQIDVSSLNSHESSIVREELVKTRSSYHDVRCDKTFESRSCRTMSFEYNNGDQQQQRNCWWPPKSTQSASSRQHACQPKHTQQDALQGCSRAQMVSVIMALTHHAAITGANSIYLSSYVISRLLSSRRCATTRGVIRKYHLMLCRRCFRELSNDIGFKKVLYLFLFFVSPIWSLTRSFTCYSHNRRRAHLFLRLRRMLH